MFKASSEAFFVFAITPYKATRFNYVNLPISLKTACDWPKVMGVLRNSR